MERTGIYCVLLALLVLVAVHTCYGQKPDLIIRYGKSYPARPRALPKPSFYAKRNQVLLQDSNGISPEYPGEEETGAAKPVIDDEGFFETPFDFDPFSLWRSQRQRMTRPKFPRN
ncbi:uncharacterized protein LOC119729472 [Patiria miniata]|uniref:Uncharacterized protein n=1 Tax=Patiria miniata TaxID=46514 RepID=A0A914A3L3_PATMI|nr:uncharacterized protein LOC119729472 [Patiria miniata]